MKNCITKRILVVALTLVTAFTSVPINAFAEDCIDASIETEEVSASLDEDIVVETDSEIESDEETVAAAIEALEEDPSSEVLPGENSEIVSEEIISEEQVIENKEEEIIPEEEIPSEEVIEEEELLDSQLPIEKPELKAMPKAKAALLGAGNTRKATVSYNYSDVTVKYRIREFYMTSSGMPDFKNANINSLVPGTYYNFEVIPDMGSISNYEYEFQSITVNGVNNIDNNNTSIGFVMPDKDINITINFEKKERVKINFSTSANMNVSYKYKIYDWNSNSSDDNHVGREVTNGMVIKNDAYIIHIYDFDSNYRIESVEVDNNNGYISTCDNNPNSNNEFTAYYNDSNQVTIKVNFKANNFDVTIHYLLLNNNISDSYTVNADAYFEIPKCTYSFGDYEVIGYKLKDGGATLYKEGDKILVNQNLYLEAQFDKIKYTIYFNSNNGKNEKISIKDYIDATSKYPECPFENEGYKFIGWTKDINSYDYEYIRAANEEFKFYDAFFDYDIYETDYYALWEKVDTAKLTITSNNTIPFYYDVFESDVNNNIYDKVTTLPYLKTGKYYVIILRDYDNIDYYPYLADESNPLVSRIDEGKFSINYLLDDINIGINFKEKEHKQPTFSSSVSPVNSGIIEGINKNAKPGEVLKLNAVANPGYTFDYMVIKWYNKKYTIGSNSYDFTVPETNYDISITAYFKQEKWNLSYDINILMGGRATLTKSSLTYGETSFFEAIPNEGWKVKEVSWIYDGKRITCDDQKIKFTAREELPKHTLINVEFERVYKITAISDPAEGGTIKLSHNEAAEGETVKVTVNANPGYKIVDIIPEENAPFDAKHVNDNTYEFTFEMADKDVMFKVSYEKITPFNVTFDANGGTGTIDTVKVLPNEEITLPVNTFERDGYSFDGWDINGTSYKAGDKVKVTADLAVKAMWLINAYELTFDTNYPEANLKPVVIVNGKIHVDTIDFNTEFSIGVNDFDNENYAIDKVLVDNTKVTLTDNSFSYTMPSHDVKIEVDFVKKLSVSFDANGASGSIDSFKVIPNEEITLLANTFVRDGYSFDGWSINDASYKAGEKVKVTSDIVVKANWKVNSYNLTFESNYNEANLKPIVILKGKDFNGKVDFDDEFLLNLYNYDKENYQIVKTTLDGKEIDNDLSKVYKMPSHDVKVVVTFVKKLVVTFDANGGKGSIDTLKVMPNEEIKLPKNSFTRSGYTFKGWDIDGKTYKVNDTVVIEKDTTIKAKWSKNPDPAPTNDDNNNNNDSNDSGNNDSNSSSSQGSDTKKAETAAAPATVTSSQAKNTSSKVTTDEAVTSNDNAEETNDSKVETKESKDEETKEVSKSDEEDQPASLAITDDNVPEGNSNTNTNTNEPETDNTDDGMSALELVGIISAFIIALLALIVTVSASVRRRRK